MMARKTSSMQLVRPPIVPPLLGRVNGPKSDLVDAHMLPFFSTLASTGEFSETPHT
jgi:hypothetical protein